MNALEINSLKKSFGGRKVISNLSFSVMEGEFVSIVGSFGCGKTTLLKIIAGLTDYEGEVQVMSKSPAQAKTGHLIGFSFQKPTLLPWLNVIENIMLPAKLNGIYNKKKAIKLLALIGLKNRKDSLVYELSGGMQKMTAILRSLVLEPKILLLDEPFHSIDEISRDNIHELILKIHKETKQTTILVTHSLSEAVYLSDRVVVLSKNPARVKNIIPIEIKKRDPKVKYSIEILKYVKRLKDAIDD